MRIIPKNNQGAIIVSILIILPVFLLIMTAYLQLSVTSFRVAKSDQYKVLAQFAADAGIDKSIEEINLNSNWAGTASDVTIQNNSTATLKYSATVDNPDSSTKILRVTGKSYRNSTAPSPSYTIKIDVELKAVQSQEFSIITGVGGLILENSSKVLGGDVFVNGEVTMLNTSQIGLSVSPVNLSVAHQTCPVPADANYPRLCANGENGEPISIANSAHVYGDVKANNQVTTAGMSDPGLTASSGVDPKPLPPHDRDAQKAAVAGTRTGADASCTTNGGIKVWAANTKIEGDVTISKSCVVKLEGDVWITGNFTMLNQGILAVANTLGSTMPDVMIDGRDTFIRNSAVVASNSSNTGARLITYWSAASCSPDCSDVTGPDLVNSRDQPTITLEQSSSGPQSIFYTKYTKVLVQNSGQIGALVGQTVHMQNAGAIAFGSTISGEVTFWRINSYIRNFD